MDFRFIIMGMASLAMDPGATLMDFLIKHWAPYPRRFPGLLPVVSSDFLRAKRQRIGRRFPTFNFSLILRGGGDYRLNGQRHAVTSPCVLMQWPGPPFDYGPSGAHEAWDECYVIYAASAGPALRRAGFLVPGRFRWPIRDLPAVESLLADLAQLSRSPAPERVVDRVDRLWERVLLETLLEPSVTDEEARRFARLAARLRERLAEEPDWDDLARGVGMSHSTFRRAWQRHIGRPPARFLLELRLREACRLLAETHDPVKVIARRVGYEDEFHFSRRFRAHAGVPPRDYRRAFQLNRTEDPDA